MGDWTPAEKILPPQDTDDKDIILIVPPVVAPDEPEVIELPDSDTKPLDLAPPMQADLPQPVQPDSFVQKVQPPPPEGVPISGAMTIVPEVRNPRAFDGIRVFDISALDQTPVPRFQVSPQYPFEMRRGGITGEVVVDFVVDTRGEVQNAFALRSTQREFEAAAVHAVSKWKFKPGRKDGRDVATHMQVPIVFRLNEP